MEVDCVIIDEAGQMSLGSVSLVLRSLTADGRIVIAGDSEQLAPILSAQYPQLKDYSLFGSVLDCLMFSQSQSKAEHAWPLSQASDNDEEPVSQGTVIQLTENFR
jgi:ATP-dependent exoDNAse (exonuclease V) alpha subunit